MQLQICRLLALALGRLRRKKGRRRPRVSGSSESRSTVPSTAHSARSNGDLDEAVGFEESCDCRTCRVVCASRLARYPKGPSRNLRAQMLPQPFRLPRWRPAEYFDRGAPARLRSPIIVLANWISASPHSRCAVSFAGGAFHFSRTERVSGKRRDVRAR
jgi:hypothetical protein